MMDYVIGVDIGTSSAKTILINTQGELLSWVRWEYPMYRPHPGWAENDPDDWVNAVDISIHKLLDDTQIDPKLIRAICIVSQRDPIVLLDVENRG